jgi:hypothetical protein
VREVHDAAAAPVTTRQPPAGLPSAFRHGCCAAAWSLDQCRCATAPSLSHAACAHRRRAATGRAPRRASRGAPAPAPRHANPRGAAGGRVLCRRARRRRRGARRAAGAGPGGVCGRAGVDQGGAFADASGGRRWWHCWCGGAGGAGGGRGEVSQDMFAFGRRRAHTHGPMSYTSCFSVRWQVSEHTHDLLWCWQRLEEVVVQQTFP